MPRRLDGERRNSLPTHLSESERERAVGMRMEGGTDEKGLEGERVRVSVKVNRDTTHTTARFETRRSLLSLF